MALKLSSVPSEKPEEADKQEQQKGLVARWLRKLRRVLRSGYRRTETAHLKRDISRLEKKRAQEKAALRQQRRFYERLLRRRTEPTPLPAVPKSARPPVTPSTVAAAASEATPPLAASLPEGKEDEIVAPAVSPRPPEPPIPLMRESEPMTEKKEEPALPLQPAAVSPPPAPEPPKKASGTLRSRLAEKLAAERESEEALEHKNEVEERFWQPYGSIKTNLVKDQGVLFFNWQQRLLTLCLSLVLCCLAISLIYVGLLIWQKERLEANQATFANYDAINIEINKNEAEIQEIIAFNQKLEIVSSVLANHVYWTNFLAFLENYTLKDVYLENFSGDLSGTYTIPSIARSLDTISLQLEVFKAYNMIRTVGYENGETIPDAQGQSTLMKFNLGMSIDQKVFLK